MSEPEETTGPPSIEKLLRSAQDASDLEIENPEKVEILRINDQEALVRVMDAEADIASRVVQLS